MHIKCVTKRTELVQCESQVDIRPDSAHQNHQWHHCTVEIAVKLPDHDHQDRDNPNVDRVKDEETELLLVFVVEGHCDEHVDSQDHGAYFQPLSYLS